MAGTFTLMIQGFVALAISGYLWRGARRRGWRDRVGRLITIVGCLLLGVALLQANQMITASGGAPDSADAGKKILLTFATFGLPAAILMTIGTRMAKEKITLTAHAKADL